MAIHFKISKYLGWSGQSVSPDQLNFSNLICSDNPDVAEIPPMLRRKLNLLGRACVSLALKISPEISDFPIVYCSQHGDMDRTMHVLNDLADGEVVSPMQFSLAVHNAICGVLSIQTGNRASISALSAGKESLIPVLLEALGLLESGHGQVLCIICDAPLTQIYCDGHSLPIYPYAVALMITMDEGQDMALVQLPESRHKTDPCNESADAIALVEFLSSQRLDLEAKHNGTLWQLSKMVSG